MARIPAYLSGVPSFPAGIKGGRRAYKWAQTKRRLSRNVQRYFGAGRYDIGPRESILFAKSFTFGTTKQGHKITGTSARSKKARDIATKLGKAHKRRIVTGIGAVYGSLIGASVYRYRKQKKHKVISRRKKS